MTMVPLVGHLAKHPSVGGAEALVVARQMVNQAGVWHEIERTG